MAPTAARPISPYSPVSPSQASTPDSSADLLNHRPEWRRCRIAARSRDPCHVRDTEHAHSGYEQSEPNS